MTRSFTKYYTLSFHTKKMLSAINFPQVIFHKTTKKEEKSQKILWSHLWSPTVSQYTNKVTFSFLAASCGQWKEYMVGGNKIVRPLFLLTYCITESPFLSQGLFLYCPRCLPFSALMLYWRYFIRGQSCTLILMRFSCDKSWCIFSLNGSAANRMSCDIYIFFSTEDTDNHGKGRKVVYREMCYLCVYIACVVQVRSHHFFSLKNTLKTVNVKATSSPWVMETKRKFPLIAFSYILFSIFMWYFYHFISVVRFFLEKCLYMYNWWHMGTLVRCFWFWEIFFLLQHPPINYPHTLLLFFWISQAFDSVWDHCRVGAIYVFHFCLWSYDKLHVDTQSFYVGPQWKCTFMSFIDTHKVAFNKRPIP